DRGGIHEGEEVKEHGHLQNPRDRPYHKAKESIEDQGVERVQHASQPKHQPFDHEDQAEEDDHEEEEVARRGVRACVVVENPGQSRTHGLGQEQPDVKSGDVQKAAKKPVAEAEERVDDHVQDDDGVEHDQLLSSAPSLERAAARIRASAAATSSPVRVRSSDWKSRRKVRPFRPSPTWAPRYSS